MHLSLAGSSCIVVYNETSLFIIKAFGDIIHERKKKKLLEKFKLKLKIKNPFLETDSSLPLSVPCPASSCGSKEALSHLMLPFGNIDSPTGSNPPSPQPLSPPFISTAP
jgi:hypothetical protein